MKTNETETNNNNRWWYLDFFKWICYNYYAVRYVFRELGIYDFEEVNSILYYWYLLDKEEGYWE